MPALTGLGVAGWCCRAATRQTSRFALPLSYSRRRRARDCAPYPNVGRPSEDWGCRNTFPGRRSPQWRFAWVFGEKNGFFAENGRFLQKRALSLLKTSRGEMKTARAEIKTPRAEMATARGEMKRGAAPAGTSRAEMKTPRAETATARGGMKTPRAETITSRAEMGSDGGIRAMARALSAGTAGFFPKYSGGAAPFQFNRAD